MVTSQAPLRRVEQPLLTNGIAVYPERYNSRIAFAERIDPDAPGVILHGPRKLAKLTRRQKYARYGDGTWFEGVERQRSEVNPDVGRGRVAARMARERAQAAPETRTAP
jgi:hypothetical protein